MFWMPVQPAGAVSQGAASQTQQSTSEIKNLEKLPPPSIHCHIMTVACDSLGCPVEASIVVGKGFLASVAPASTAG
jgi:hypothetical protein